MSDNPSNRLDSILGSKEEREELLNEPLRCHHIGCGKQFKNMPQLKNHLSSH